MHSTSLEALLGDGGYDLLAGGELCARCADGLPVEAAHRHRHAREHLLHRRQGRKIHLARAGLHRDGGLRAKRLRGGEAVGVSETGASAVRVRVRVRVQVQVHRARPAPVAEGAKGC